MVAVVEKPGFAVEGRGTGTCLHLPALVAANSRAGRASCAYRDTAKLTAMCLVMLEEMAGS